MQQGQPVASASRALSNPEINYAPIEKEMLAIVFGCERLNMYTHGAEGEVNSDHKPLENIFKKPLFKVPPKGYVCRSTISKLGMFQGSSFTLLTPCPGHAGSPISPMIMTCIKTWGTLFLVSRPISDVKLKELREFNRNDPTMHVLHTYSMEGWPHHKRDVPHL